MKRTIIAIVAALALPTAAMAQDPTPAPSDSAAKACKTEKAQMGASTFTATYATNKKKSNAFGKCVSKRTSVESANQDNAAKQCKAERAADPAAFADKYGTNKTKSNAYGKCVSSKAKAASAAKTDADVSAAKDCKTERAADPAAFKAKYGTNKNKSNAFGKCVSATAKAKQETDDTQQPAQT
jgi:hypothetical protein